MSKKTIKNFNAWTYHLAYCHNHIFLLLLLLFCSVMMKLQLSSSSSATLVNIQAKLPILQGGFINHQNKSLNPSFSLSSLYPSFFISNSLHHSQYPSWSFPPVNQVNISSLISPSSLLIIHGVLIQIFLFNDRVLQQSYSEMGQKQGSTL